MKKKMIFAAVAMLLSAAAVTGFLAYNKTDAAKLLNADVEALTGCEITNKGGKILFSCKGENTCSGSYLGKTLTCDGTKQDL